MSTLLCWISIAPAAPSGPRRHVPPTKDTRPAGDAREYRCRDPQYRNHGLRDAQCSRSPSLPSAAKPVAGERRMCDGLLSGSVCIDWRINAKTLRKRQRSDAGTEKQRLGPADSDWSTRSLARAKAKRMAWFAVELAPEISDALTSTGIFPPQPAIQSDSESEAATAGRRALARSSGRAVR